MPLHRDLSSVHLFDPYASRRQRRDRLAWASNRARRFAFATTLLSAVILGGAGAGAATYDIQGGDVLEFSVASLPNLKQRVAVDINGDVNFPLLRDIHAAGVTLGELRTKVREFISAKPIRERGSDGREVLLTIDPDEISISIVEYRPIYITGDVGRPGEQPFRPGITVRQAIALGGGSDAGQLNAGAKALQVVDLRSEYQTAWVDLVAKRTLSARLTAELDNRSTFAEDASARAPIDPSIQHVISGREADELSARVKDYNNEKDFIARSVTEAEKFQSVLVDQQSNEKQGADLDAQDFDRVNALFSKGAVPITRVIDARRSMLLSSTRQLQTTVQTAENQIRKDALVRSMDKLTDQRRADLVQQLQAAGISTLELQERLASISRKLAILGKSDGADRDVPPDITVFRQGSTVADVTDDTELRPGDVVKVKMRSDDTTLQSALP